jgi:hypothetical protein
LKTTLILLTALFFVFANSCTNAQQTKLKYASRGTWEFGGDIAFTSTTYTYRTEYIGYHESAYSTTIRNFDIYANAGYFIIKGLKLGIETGVGITNFYKTQTTLKLYFAPEYVLSTGSDAYPFAGVSAGFKSINPYYNQSANGFSWGIKAGVKVNLAGNSLLNVAIKYYEEQYKTHIDYFGIPNYSYDVKDKLKQLGLSAGWSLFF